MVSRFVGNPDYRLVWPPEVLQGELRWLASHPAIDAPAASLVFEEAFLGDEPKAELERAGESWGHGPRALVLELLEAVDELPLVRRPAPLWHERRGIQLPTPAGVSQPPSPTVAAPGELFDSAYCRFVRQLWELGYFRQVVPKVCVDAGVPINDPDFDMDMELWSLLGVRGLWPLKPEDWSDDTRWALVEALGDLVARPRRRTWHSWDQCGWHCSQFSPSCGQALYRARVNELLGDSGMNLRLATDGEDLGRLVRVADGELEQLAHDVIQGGDAGDRPTRAHAVALFRARAAGEAEKRSAVVALAALLEERRPLLKERLTKKDEGALFQIANEFHIRHRRADQRGDYDESFLDWFFWWYLATLELTDHLLGRPGSA